MIVHELQSLEIGVRGVKSDTYNYVPRIRFESELYYSLL
jgi:hypothetical protein